MSLVEYTLLAFTSLFVIVDPIGAVPAFLAMTPDDSVAARVRMARLACGVTAGVLLAFALAGKWVFRLFGITLPAFQIAASIVLLLVALDMLRAQRSRVYETHEERTAGRLKEDVAITPLAIPMLAGPGAISTVILLQSRAETVAQLMALGAAIIAVAIVTYVILHITARGAQWLTPIAIKITSRIMGLLLAALAIQFMLNALVEVKQTLF
ncbi:MAG: MarC family protein [Verrucomicrobiae bacterium]|nr:MarC family protein [Verrucomicrobiae bacterium]MDW7979620.1 MarC family protein [Verrucomicrobiales bacterium]